MPISTLNVTGIIDEGFKTEIKASHNFVIDQPKPGGTDLGANPLEHFLSSIAGCICAIGRIIANQRRITLRGMNVVVEGDLDKDFLLGKTEEGRAGFTEIRLFIDVDADLSKEEKEKFVKDVEMRCPIADNVINGTIVTLNLKY